MDITQLAMQYIGTPYLWGGSSPTGFDCSGLVQYVYGQAGIQVPRTTYDQWGSNIGQKFYDMSQAQPGDLVYFEPSAQGPGHVGIYVGNGMMIDAPHTGAYVRFDQVSSFGQIVGFMRVQGAQGSALNNPSGNPNPNPSPVDVQKVIQDSYGYMSWALGIPELNSIITQAAKEGWSQGRFQSALQGTDWWKSHASTARQWIQLQSTDPATAQREVNQKTADITQLAMRLGINITPDRLKAMASDSLMLGWDQVELNNAVLAESNFQQTEQNIKGGQVGAGGNIASIMMQLKGQAAKYLVPLSDADAYNWAVKELQTGSESTNQGADQGFVAYLQQAAKARFGQGTPVAQAIDQGIAPNTFFDPLRQNAARMLEVSPDQIDLMNNPQFGKMIDTVDPKTGERRPMTMYEQNQYLRGMPQWQQTTNANQEAGQLAMGLLKGFGAVG